MVFCRGGLPLAFGFEKPNCKAISTAGINGYDPEPVSVEDVVDIQRYAIFNCMAEMTSTTTCQVMAKKTPLKMPFCGEEIISSEPRSNSAYDVFGLVRCFIVLLCVCIAPSPCLHKIFLTPLP